MLGNCNGGCDEPDAPFVSDQFDYLNFNFPFDAEIAPGGTYIVAHPSADSVILALADVTHQYLSNGDDAYGLFELAGNDTLLIDIIGAIGPDPGSGWEVAGVANATKDTLVRNEFVFTGNGGDWAMSAGTNALDSEWIVPTRMTGVTWACTPSQVLARPRPAVAPSHYRSPTMKTRRLTTVRASTSRTTPSKKFSQEA